MFRTIRQAAVQWQSDRASLLGAAVAYYTLFSFAPLLIITIAVAGIAFGQDAVEGRLVGYLTDYIGADSAEAIQTMIRQTRHPRTNWCAFAIGVGLLLFIALSLFQQLRTALQMIWKLPPDPSEGLVRATVKDYLSALAMIGIAVLFVLLLLIGTTVVTIGIEVWGHFLPGDQAIWRVGNIGVMFVLMTAFLVVTFRILSDGRMPYRCLWGGSALAAILFISGKWLFGIYLAHTTLATAYGAASSVVVFLVWVYYTAQVFFFGAEVVQVKAQNWQIRKEKI
jgi:membrane protein